jgi:hypothetical protein
MQSRCVIVQDSKSATPLTLVSSSACILSSFSLSHLTYGSYVLFFQRSTRSSSPLRIIFRSVAETYRPAPAWPPLKDLPLVLAEGGCKSVRRDDAVCAVLDAPMSSVFLCDAWHRAYGTFGTDYALPLLLAPLSLYVLILLLVFVAFNVSFGMGSFFVDMRLICLHITLLRCSPD